MKHRAVFLLAAGLLTQLAHAQVLDYSDRFKVEENGLGERFFAQPITLGRGVSVVVRTEVSSKGNGVFRLKNLELRNFDQHDDCAVFRGDALRTEFVDVDRDGYRDLVLTGAVIYTLDDHGPRRSFTEPVVWIYLYNRRKDRFELRYQNASFSLDLDGGPTTSPYYLNPDKWQSSPASP